MHLRDWLFNTVAREMSLVGVEGIDIKQMASAAGMSPKEVRDLYPDKRSLVLAVITEISEVQKDFILQHYPEANIPRDRLVQFISKSITFCDSHPNPAQVIVIALMGSDPIIKEHVFQTYERLFSSLVLDDLISEGIIPNKSLLLVSDLTQVLLSLIFLGGCPWLQMDYISFVYPDKIAASALDAMKRRYALEEFRIPTG